MLPYYIKENMGEGVRLKNEFMIENQSKEQSNQSQHPQPQNKSENLLKETPTNNNIDYTIMERSQQIVLDYLLSSEQGEILKRNGEELKKLKIGDKTYNFERNKPITDRLKRKFNKIRQTMDYKRYELKEKRGIRWINLDKNKALTGIQKRYKATITDEQSAFKNYTSSYAISDIRVKGVKAIQYLKYQDFKIKEYLRKHKGMKVLLQTFSNFKSKKTNEIVRREVRSRRYEITNEEEITNVLNQMATDIEHQAEVLEASESGWVLTQMDKIKFKFDTYLKMKTEKSMMKNVKNKLERWQTKRLNDTSVLNKLEM